LVLSSTLIAGIALGCSPLHSKGTVPPPGRNGQVDQSSSPDFVSVAGPDGGIVGYVPKIAVFPGIDPVTGRPSEASWPVYADDLVTVVGQLVPGRGFVPLGVDPATVPSIPVRVEPSFSGLPASQTETTLYVRDEAPVDAWVAVMTGAIATNGVGFNAKAIGAGCIPVPVGSRLVLLDRAPQASNAIEVMTIDAPTVSGPATLWLAIGPDESTSHGAGIPDWWTADPERC
jgi:hypothetical protein